MTGDGFERRESAAEAAAFAAILRSSPDAVIAKSVDGTVTAWNDGAMRIYGYAAHDVIGKNIELTFPIAGLDKERARHRRVAGGASESGYRCQRLRADGRPIDVVMSMSPVRDDSGDVIGVASISRLVSAAEHDEARIAALLEAAPDAVISVDRNGRIATVNAQTVALFGYPRDEVLGAKIDLLIPAVLRDLHAEERIAYLRDPELRREGAALALEARRRDGSTFPVEVSLAADGTGAGGLVIAAVRDVSQQRALEASLRAAEASARAANDAKNVFLSRMSHELRTPLNAVLGFGQLLARRLKGSEDEEAIGHILKGGRHLLDLINDVLDIATIESGKMSISAEPVHVQTVINETLDLMQPLARDADVTLTAGTGPDAYAMADRQRLRQMLLNLVSNAIKYNHRGGSVWVDYEVVADQTTLTVRDTGQGIPLEAQDRMFTPFDRLGAEGSGVDGTGIGLALTRSLAELMRGSMTVVSVPGEGSSFSVSLPVAERSAVASAPTSHVDSDDHVPPMDSSLTVLYVEDNYSNVRVIEHLMRLRPEWRLLHAGLGALGLELAAAHSPDLVLLDLHLPDVPGRDVLAALKGDARTAPIPVAILTADARIGRPRELVDAGAYRFLTKPVDVDEILDLLDSVTAGEVP